MSFLFDKCTFSVLDENTIDECDSFLCGNSDLDDFFQHDAPLYSQQLLGKSYCFRLDNNMHTIVCAFTVSNDSIRVDMRKVVLDIFFPQKHKKLNTQDSPQILI
ncbi:hypothetical protein [uncultured Bacteroides sp.]|uniref:hypothetical protein n=1 Tax=uncultured Bacteroides sp. TaxID=162156 RepID=UPI0025E2EF19|nr:hypothetical protein [uncultured Bacteroides sp.]